MALESGQFDFAGKICLSLEHLQIGRKGVGKYHVSVFDATVKTLLDDVESRHTVLADADLTVTLDTGDVDNVATQAAINFSRTLRYLLKNLTADSARSILHGRRGTS